MKSTTFVAILLTLLTLLLVTGATVFFLWQGRQDMQRDVGLQQSEIEGQKQTIAQLQTTAAAREMGLATHEAAQATSEAVQATRDMELAQMQGLLATREAELAQVQAEAADALATFQAQQEVGDGPPPLEILHPAFGASVNTDTLLPVIVVGSAADGISRMEVVVGDQEPIVREFANGETYYVFRRTISDLESGELVITATLTTGNNRTVQDSVRLFVNDTGIEEDGNGTQGLLGATVAARP